VQKAVTLQGSFSHTFRNWEQVVKLLAAGQVNLEPIVSRVSPLEDGATRSTGCTAGAT